MKSSFAWSFHMWSHANTEAHVSLCACVNSHFNICKHIFSTFIIQTNVYGQSLDCFSSSTQTQNLLNHWLKSLKATSCWAQRIWLSILDGPAKEWMSRTLHPPYTHTYMHMSCLVPLWCPWELSCCLGATASACCLAHCCMLSGCHVVCWSRRAGYLQMARQMELCFFHLWHCSQKEKASPCPGTVCELM